MKNLVILFSFLISSQLYAQESGTIIYEETVKFDMPDQGLFWSLEAGKSRVEGESELRAKVRNGALAAQLEELRVG